MGNIDYSQLTKIQKIAAFFIFIGADAAAEVMKGFDTAQLELICREMANLHVIDESVQNELISEFGELIVEGLQSKLGGVGYAQTVLAKAKGDYTAASILNRVAPSTLPSEAGEDIRQMDGRQILNLMKSEQPQTVAYLLSYLDTIKAAEIVSMLAPELREEVVERLGAMEPTTHEVLLKIARNLNRHFDKKSLHQGLHHSGGVKNVADILNALDKDMRKTLLTRIEERNAALGSAIRKKVFSFEDLTRLDRVDLQRVLREVDMGELAVALKLAKPVLIAAVMASISKRAAEGLKEDMDMLGPVKMKDVEAAQDKIIQVVRKLEETEEITLD
jgi:flagellar motor switch protein FliG